MTDDLAYECKRLRALNKMLRQDLEDRMTYFQHDREQLEKRVFELTTERDTLKRALDADLRGACEYVVNKFFEEGRITLVKRDGQVYLHLVPDVVTQ